MARSVMQIQLDFHSTGRLGSALNSDIILLQVPRSPGTAEVFPTNRTSLTCIHT